MRQSVQRLTMVVLAGGLVLGLGACGDDGDDDDASGSGSPSGSGSGSEATQPEDGGEAAAGDGIVISGFAFNEFSAAAGATVSVTNDDGSSHTVTSDDGAWDEVAVGGGESGELTAPSEPGEYAYHCEIHRTMTGTLVVE